MKLQKEPTTMAPRRGAWRRALLTLALLLIFLIPAEWLLKMVRVRGPARTDMIQGTYMPTRFRPNFRGPIGDLNEVTTNRFGFRGETDFPRRRPAGEYRILALGDSVGFGFGVEPDQTYCRQVEKLLGTGGRRLRLMNAAGQGYSPSSYLAYLQAEGLGLQPNLVLVQVEPSNDVTDEALIRITGNEKIRVHGGRYCVTWDGNLLGSVTLGPYFYERTYLYTLLTRRALQTLDALFPHHSALSSPGNLYYHLGFDRFLFTSARLESGWGRTQHALEQSRAISAQQGVRFVLLLTPTLYAFHDNERLRRFGNGIMDRTAAWAGRHSIDYIDPREALLGSGGTALFTDFAHLTAEGHRILAGEVAAHLQGYLP